MADVESNAPTRKKSTKVDMTAMVDVAFLLLTFFILTTTLTGPMKMEIIKPVDDLVDGPERIQDDKVLTLILGEADQIHYYAGIPGDVELRTTNFGDQGLRQLIREHLYRKENPCGQSVHGNCWDPIFVVKPNSTSRYKNLVDTIDELNIAGARKFSYQEISGFEKELLAEARKR